MSEFQDGLRKLINHHSMENGSDTPDFILASFLAQSLAAFNGAVTAREGWYGRGAQPCAVQAASPIGAGRRVYLAGAMAGKTDAECNDWRDRATSILAGHGIQVHNPMIRDFRGIDMTLEQSRQLVADDMADIRRSWAVLVKADDGASWGTAMETFFAGGILGKRTVAFVGWRLGASPWVAAHAQVVETLEDACAALAASSLSIQP